MPRPQAPAAIDHYENFPVASWLCPPALRAPVAAIYHYARTADDLADEGSTSAEQRLRDLQHYRAELVQACAPPEAADGAPPARWPQVFGPLRLCIQRHALPTTLLHDLLDAFVQDVAYSASARSYADQRALDDYCRRSAHPIGRLLLHLYGVHDAQALACSDAICTALQRINFWQDLSVDIPRGRYYLPDQACAAYGVERADLLALRQTLAATRLIASQVDLARAAMESGMPLVHRLGGRAGWELRLVIQGGLRILDKIAALGHATLLHRPVLGRGDYAVMLWRALWM